MDPRSRAQDVLRCHLCETPVPPMYCDICKLNLCKPCVGEHISDESTEHKVVPLKKRGSTLYCMKHSTKLCELHCEQCDVPICVHCISSGEHHGHKQGDILKFLEIKNEAVQKDLKELELLIYPNYQEIAHHISVQKGDLIKNSHKLKTALDEQGKNLHREIDNAIKELKANVDELESKHLGVLEKHEDELKCNISDITEMIADVKKLLSSNDVSLVSSYKSGNAKFRRLPSKVTVDLPTLSPQKINKQHIYQLFGSLSAVPITLECSGYSMDTGVPMVTRLEEMQLSKDQQFHSFQVEENKKMQPDNLALHLFRPKQLKKKRICKNQPAFVCTTCNKTFLDANKLQLHKQECEGHDGMLY